MNWPTLPTDNLYKFVAFAGIVITILAAAAPLKAIWDVEERISAAQAESQKLEEQADFLRERLEVMGLTAIASKPNAELADQERVKKLEALSLTENLRLRLLDQQHQHRLLEILNSRSGCLSSA